MPPSVYKDKEDIFQNCLHFPINLNPSQANRLLASQNINVPNIYLCCALSSLWQVVFGQRA